MAQLIIKIGTKHMWNYPYFHSSPFDYTYFIIIHCNLRDYTVYSRNCEKINNVQSLKKLPTCLPYNLHVFSAIYLFCLFTNFFRALLCIIIPFTLRNFAQKLTFDTAVIVKPFSGSQKEWKLLKSTVCKSSTFSNLFDRLYLFRYGLKDFFPLAHDH